MQENLDENQKKDQEIFEDENAGFKLRNAVLGFVISLFIIGFVVFAFTVEPVNYKPAIYLYPENTTQISVKLDKTIKYKNVIPKYKNGWYVEAEPNGVLRDLQPKYTNCEKLPYKEFGFEYSKQACEINKYPYIYWDGVQVVKPVPKKNEGFIVKSENIEDFLSKKADELNFNKEEKVEFVRYWNKKVKNTGWKQVKIYFLQNEDVENYLPLYIDPRPDNINRVEIVITKAKKNEKIKEQTLIPFNRSGYTMVEWGGMILR